MQAAMAFDQPEFEPNRCEQAQPKSNPKSRNGINPKRPLAPSSLKPL